MRTFRYGESASQSGDLHLPAEVVPPVVCLLHGGFWRTPFGRDQFDAVARDLVERGYAVWNVGYRRVGEAGGGWPGTLEDVVTATEHLALLSDETDGLDLQRVVVAGHSAGGQLALHAVAHANSVRPLGAVSLAGVVDMRAAHALNLGNGAAAALLGGAPDEVPERYAVASPVRGLPLGVRQLLIHGNADTAVPAQMSRDYAQAAHRAGDAVELVEIPGMGHMDYLDPAGRAHATLCDWLSTLPRTP